MGCGPGECVVYLKRSRGKGQRHRNFDTGIKLARPNGLVSVGLVVREARTVRNKSSSIGDRIVMSKSMRKRRIQKQRRLMGCPGEDSLGAQQRIHMEEPGCLVGGMADSSRSIHNTT
jgi:hypothetical protein